MTHPVVDCIAFRFDWQDYGIEFYHRVGIFWSCSRLRFQAAPRRRRLGYMVRGGPCIAREHRPHDALVAAGLTFRTSADAFAGNCWTEVVGVRWV